MKENLLFKDLQRTHKTSDQEDLNNSIKELAPLLKIDLERKKSQDGIEMFLMVIAILVISLATKP